MKGSKPALNPEQIKECIRRKDEDYESYQSIALDYGINRSTVEKYCRRYRV